MHNYPPKTLQNYFDEAGIKHFKAKEFLVLGSGHLGGKCKGLNSLPSEALYGNITKVAQVWDLVRNRVGKPIYVTSVYRNEPYNKCIGGVKSSQHLYGRAADCGGPNSQLLADTATVIREMGAFKGGIGIYNNFVHIDVRGTNHTWDKR